MITTYKSIKINNKEEFDYLQNYFLNNGYNWITTGKKYMNYDKYNTILTFLVDYENKRLGTYGSINRYECEHFIVEKAIEYKKFLRQFKFKKLYD